MQHCEIDELKCASHYKCNSGMESNMKSGKGSLLVEVRNTNDISTEQYHGYWY